MPSDRGDEGRAEERSKVKVTDKRRVRPDEDPPADAAKDEAAPEKEAAEDARTDDLAEARRQAAEYLDHLQRLKAEFENYRKRVLREQTRAVELASETLVLKLLEVLDEFGLALVAAEQKPDFEKFLKGVEMVYAKIADILRSEGLEPIEAKGKPFDPELHEALFQSGDEEGEPYVADVLRPGYTLKGKVLRAAGVKVERR
jgi:molecular chaperone GrpE